MRTKADIIDMDSGGQWSDVVTVSVPAQPNQMTNEDFNVTAYTYR